MATRSSSSPGTGTGWPPFGAVASRRSGQGNSSSRFFRRSEPIQEASLVICTLQIYANARVSAAHSISTVKATLHLRLWASARQPSLASRKCCVGLPSRSSCNARPAFATAWQSWRALYGLPSRSARQRAKTGGRGSAAISDAEQGFARKWGILPTLNYH